MDTLLANRINLIQKQDTRCLASGSFEEFVKIAFTLTEIDIEHVIQSDYDEACIELAGCRARNEGLAAAWGAEEQKTASQ